MCTYIYIRTRIAVWDYYKNYDELLVVLRDALKKERSLQFEAYHLYYNSFDSSLVVVSAI